MVDFKKRTDSQVTSRPVDPVAIYNSLDRAHDKGPLRPAQLAVLTEWHRKRRDQRDLILKMHTGQGKTLLGLLMLQSKLNEGKGPALYLCPNNFLIAQTQEQAVQFGLRVVTPDAGGDLPDDFHGSKAILVTSIQKLFNGRTKFGLGAKSLPVGSMVMDDSHACIDAMKQACNITIPRESNAYVELRDLFSRGLQQQGAGTYADLRRHEWDAILPVPYWDWIDKSEEVAGILSKYSESKEIWFTWPLVKDSLADCSCVFSGVALEIHPNLPPLHLFGSYAKAQHRVFMSATVTDDSFLVKGLGLDQAIVRSPLSYSKERWSGEKLVLIPSLIDPTLGRGSMVKRFGRRAEKRTYGVVALCPSFEHTQDWKGYGAEVATSADIESLITRLRSGSDFSKPIVVVNRYDGIDLPDNACRILILDSKPFAESILDRYMERCLGDSEAISIRVARRIEQGLGRSVRGEKDYCAFVLTGPDLINQVRSPMLQKHFSPQTRLQLELGMEIAKFAKEDAGDKDPDAVLDELLKQSLSRDEDWKTFYAERMNALPAPRAEPSGRLAVYAEELKAEKFAQTGEYDAAAKTLQALIDKFITDPAEKGWFLQEMARHRYRQSKVEAGKLQADAHKKNRYLLRPQAGVSITKIAPLAQRRVENIISRTSQFDSFHELAVAVDDVLGSLSFGTSADRFESALDRLAPLLGFAGERPEKEWKEGPDNLWCLRAGEYVLWECKSEVALDRAEIAKYEAEQMNSSAAWFEQNYKGTEVTRVLVIPAKKLGSASAFLLETHLMRKKGLDQLVKNVRAFFGEFKGIDLRSIGEARVQAALDEHHLSINDLTKDYLEKPKQA